MAAKRECVGHARGWRPDGTVAIDLDALSLLPRLCGAVPLPRQHQVRYAGPCGATRIGEQSPRAQHAEAQCGRERGSRRRKRRPALSVHEVGSASQENIRDRSVVPPVPSSSFCARANQPKRDRVHRRVGHRGSATVRGPSRQQEMSAWGSRAADPQFGGLPCVLVLNHSTRR